ncbi:g4253 [Coccomyxa elongata]
MHQAIVNQYSVDLKKEERAAVLAMGLVMEKEARIQESSGVVLAYTERLQMSQAKVMRLEGRFDMRGLIEVVEQKYKDKRLSGFIHTGVDVYTTGEFALPILLGPLSPEEAKALQCLADDVSVHSEIHAYDPTSRRSKEVCSHSG